MHHLHHTHQDDERKGVSRRHLLMGAVGLSAAAATGGLVGVGPADAAKIPVAKPLPKPISGGFDSGDPNVGFVHLFLPGPTDAVTPVLGLQGEGLDVEPSTITDFEGFTAFAVLAGEARANDGNTYPVELDVRVMEGKYIAENGKTANGAFAFL